MRPGLRAKRVFLTGASGFIGARIAECLTRAYGAEVHALVRRPGTAGAARLARLPGMRLHQGDIRDAQAVGQAAAGSSLFVHCATGTSGNWRERMAVTVDGTRTVLEVGRRQGAERVVYFSSASVHDPARSVRVIHEDDRVNGRAHARAKILAERVVEEFRRRHSLPVVTLRPTCVWGPFSPIWTVSAAELIRDEVALLPRGGRGVANLVYIDNLVDSVVLALTNEEAIGHTFLINDDEPGIWAELYGGYARCLEVPLRFVPESHGVGRLPGVSLYNAGLILGNVLRGRTALGHVPREVYEHVPAVKLLVSLLPEEVKYRLRQSEIARQEAAGPRRPAADARSPFLPYSFLPRETRELYGSMSRYSNEKAKRVLGWTSRRSFEEALATTCQWLEYAGYKDSGG